jgi:hypothetical protein
MPKLEKYRAALFEIRELLKDRGATIRSDSEYLVLIHHIVTKALTDENHPRPGILTELHGFRDTD